MGMCSCHGELECLLLNYPSELKFKHSNLKFFFSDNVSIISSLDIRRVVVHVKDWWQDLVKLELPSLRDW